MERTKAQMNSETLIEAEEGTLFQFFNYGNLDQDYMQEIGAEQSYRQLIIGEMIAVGNDTQEKIATHLKRIADALQSFVVNLPKTINGIKCFPDGHGGWLSSPPFEGGELIK